MTELLKFKRSTRRRVAALLSSLSLSTTLAVSSYAQPPGQDKNGTSLLAQSSDESPQLRGLPDTAAPDTAPSPLQRGTQSIGSSSKFPSPPSSKQTANPLSNHAANSTGKNNGSRNQAPSESASANNSSSPNLKDALKADFAQHIQSLANMKKAPPDAAATGAASPHTIPILLKDSAANTGPSKPSNVENEEDVIIARPVLSSLISVNEYLDPFLLDAANSQSITLKDSLHFGINHNLDLGISHTQTKQQQYGYYSSLGNFLPDPTLGYSEYFAKGKIGLPTSFSNSFAGAAGASSGSGSLVGAAAQYRNNKQTINVNKPFIVMHAGAEYHLYRGGSVVFGALKARNELRASRYREHANLSDTLLGITQNYYNLVLAECLLQIRVDAVRTSEEELRKNSDRFHSGLATNLDVLQSKTQLSRDRQALLDQQANRRSASIKLLQSMNASLGSDVFPTDLEVHKIRLIDPKLNIAQLLSLAIDLRPELKQYEQLRLAAKKQIAVAAANLQPSVSITGNAYGIGPPNNNRALGVVALNANWRLRGFGVVDSMQVQQAKWKAREAAIESQKELQDICAQVRNSYVQILVKESKIEEAKSEVRSSLEELRLAELRKSSGLGLNLDIITAQRDYTQARVAKAQAIVDYNLAQAQLLHDIGAISVDSLTSGLKLSASK